MGIQIIWQLNVHFRSKGIFARNGKAGEIFNRIQKPYDFIIRGDKVQSHRVDSITFWFAPPARTFHRAMFPRKDLKDSVEIPFRSGDQSTKPDLGIRTWDSEPVIAG